MSYTLEREIGEIAKRAIDCSNPTIALMQSEIRLLKEKLENMERCCVCVKMNAPMETE